MILMGAKDLLKIAQAEFPNWDLKECVDIGDRLAFYFEPSEPTPGIPYVVVNKNSGQVTYLTIPPLQNLALIRNGQRVELEQ